MDKLELIDRWKSKEQDRVARVAEGFLYLAQRDRDSIDREERAVDYVAGAQVAYGENIDRITVNHFVLEATAAEVIHRSEYEVTGKRSLDYRDGLYGREAVMNLLMNAIDLGIIIEDQGKLSVPVAQSVPGAERV